MSNIIFEKDLDEPNPVLYRFILYVMMDVENGEDVRTGYVGDDYAAACANFKRWKSLGKSCQLFDNDDLIREC